MTKTTAASCRMCSKPSDTPYCSDACHEGYVAQIKAEEKAFFDNVRPMPERLPVMHLEAVPTVRAVDPWAGESCPMCNKAYEYPPESGIHRQDVAQKMVQAADLLATCATLPSYGAAGGALQQMGLILSDMNDHVTRAWASASRWRHVAEHAQTEQGRMQVMQDAALRMQQEMKEKLDKLWTAVIGPESLDTPGPRETQETEEAVHAP